MGIKPALGRELFMCPHINHATLIHDDDAVGFDHCCQAVRDDQCGPALHNVL